MLRTISIVAVVASALCAPHAAGQAERVTQAYDVSALVLASVDSHGPTLGFEATAPGALFVEEPDSDAYTADELVGLVKSNVDPGAWEKENSVSGSGSTLHVTAPAATQARVRALLDWLRARHARPVVLEVSVREAEARHADLVLAGGPVLDAERAAALDAEPWVVVRSARLRAYSGQRVHLGRTEVVRYLADYDLEVAQEAHVYDPVTERIRTGTIDELRPVLSDDGKAVFVECAHTVCTADAPFPAFGTGLRALNGALLAPLDQPVVGTRQLRNALWMPAGGRSIVGAGRFGDHVRVLLVRHLERAEVLPPAPGGDAKRALKVFDARHAVHAPLDYMAPSLDDVPTAPAAGKPMADATVDTGARMTLESLIAMVEQNVDEDSWHNERNRMQAARGRLIVLQSAETLAKVEEYLRAVERARGVSILVRAQVLYAHDDDAARDLAGLVGDALTPEQRAALVARAAEGRGVEVVSDLSTVALPAQRVHAAVIARQPFVADYDAEIAIKSHGLDPVVELHAAGAVLAARASLVDGGASVALDLELDDATLGEVAPRAVGGEIVAQAPALARSSRAAFVVLAAGGTVVIDLAGRRYARVEVYVSRAADGGK